MAYHTIRPALIRERLSANLCVIMRRASLALQGVETGDTSKLGRFPGAWIGMECGDLDTEAEVKVREDADSWVLGASFGTLLIVVDLALQSAADCCNFACLASHGPLTQADADQIPLHQQRFEKHNYPNKVKYLRETYGADVMPARTQDIDAYRDARNCLEHRHGVVGIEDLRGRPHLEVRWSAIEPVIIRHSGAVEVVQVEDSGRPVGGGVLVAAGEQIGTRAIVRQRSFKLAERIKLSRQDFAEICVNVHLWGVELSQTVEAFVRKTVPLSVQVRPQRVAPTALPAAEDPAAPPPPGPSTSPNRPSHD